MRSNAPAAPILGWRFRGLPPAIPGWHRSTPSTDLLGYCTVSSWGMSSEKTGASALPRPVRRAPHVAAAPAPFSSALAGEVGGGRAARGPACGRACRSRPSVRTRRRRPWADDPRQRSRLREQQPAKRWSRPGDCERIRRAAVRYRDGMLESPRAGDRRRRWHSIPSATWPDAQLQYGAIARRVGQRPAPYAVAVLAATAVTAATGRTRPHPTPRLGAAKASEGAVADPAAAQDRAGREQVRPWYTRLPRCER